VASWFGPDVISDVLEDSARRYAFVEAPELGPNPLHALEPGKAGVRRLDPFLVVARDVDGVPRLSSRTPPPPIADAFERGAVALSADRWGVALTHFQRCVDEAPDYFKGHTYLGRAWLFLDEPRRAREHFERAIELNPLDYQAHMFMADTWMAERRWRLAKQALTRAWTINPNSEAIRSRLRSTLYPLDLRIRPRRLDPELAIRDTGEGALIQLGGERAVRWLPLAACLACWRFEDRCSQRAPGDEDPLRLTMYRECLLNQVASVAARTERGAGVGTDELSLMRAVRAGYLEALVLWEIVARRTPVMMLLVTDELRAEVEAYIDRFVYASNQVL
jgi:tetratricopeptide (TPR) repeat protein